MGLSLCKCGCGLLVTKITNKYIKGHSNKGKKINLISRKRMSISAINKFKMKPELKEYCKWKKFTYKRFITDYNFLLQEEECREFKDTFQFRCKYCNKWFTPTSIQIQERCRSIKNNIGLIHNYFYCSNKCKNKCRYYNRHSHPDKFDKLQEYRMLVYRYTASSISKFGYLIKDLNKRNLKFELDHRYSVYEGFKNNINPKIIGSYKNLQILTKKENLKKGAKCSITKEELIDGYGGSMLNLKALLSY